MVLVTLNLWLLIRCTSNLGQGWKQVKTVIGGQLYLVCRNCALNRESGKLSACLKKIG
jgi:hypothetical protein